ncbi:cysteine desulfurase [bacterium]|nr:cysteine desulfurase [bacterium]
MKRIYLDHSATTPVDKRVLEAMLPFLTEEFGNPSSLHSFGRAAKVALEEARQKIASVINASPGEIVFTSGGSEADNLAIAGVARAHRERGNHLIANRIEHHAVLHIFEELEKEGFEVTYVECDQYGMILPQTVEAAIRPGTTLISIMHVNNEVGTINPVQEIGSIAKNRNILFHTDAVQSFGKLPLDVKTMPIDLMSMSAHKIYGPKGIGALWVRRGVKVMPILYGGSQERGQRAGTENIAGAVGFGKAAELCRLEMNAEIPRLKKMQTLLWDAIQKEIPNVRLNGHPEQRLPGHLNVSFNNAAGDELLIHLDLNGIAVSTGSACTSGAVGLSHVLKGMNIEPQYGRGAVRMTLGRSSKEEDIPTIIDALKSSLVKLSSE